MSFLLKSYKYVLFIDFKFNKGRNLIEISTIFLTF